MKKLFLLSSIVLFGMLISSCNKEEITPVPIETPPTEIVIVDSLSHWNMTNSDHIHYFTNTEKITSVTVYITNDDHTKKIDLLSAGAIVFQPDMICLHRTEGGGFDNENFNSLDFSRGIIHIKKCN
jgi:hypothetical protein